MKVHVLAFLLHISLVVAGQDKVVNRRLYTPKELQEDYLIFRKALETTYPSLYRFTDSLKSVSI